ncbi:hypothetical protein GGX14DRAFT_432960 [Mycena pura]|uniref:NmrA-like domain-containing protein n=1 Tax=Mycena pura TaxID=153505 RepID=A0AAD6VRN7_9AGAR|nr:hypothetical protein GGX14DRAFT_432960 [Mycena pura]
MSAYKSFAVVGGGLVGLPVVRALVAKKVSVVLLSRPESSAKNVPPGVQVEKVDYNNVAATAAIFRKHKVDVVLSTVATTAAGTLTSLVDAAKLAEIKLFVPSEYGLPTDGQTEGALGDKNKLAAYLKDVGVPSTRIFTGMFIEFIPWISGYTDNGKITIVGNGEAPLSCTAVEDIAGIEEEYTSASTSTLTSFKLQNSLHTY